MKQDTSKSLWTNVMELEGADDMHNGCANTLTKDDVTTIIATMEFFGAELRDMQQTYFDLLTPRFRVFDWLAMCVIGRMEQSDTALKVLCYSFLKVDGKPSAFIADLRTTDYQMDESWTSIKLDK